MKILTKSAFVINIRAYRTGFFTGICYLLLRVSGITVVVFFLMYASSMVVSSGESGGVAFPFLCMPQLVIL